MSLDVIEHFIVLMLENRSFDHLLSSVPGVDGATEAMSNPDKSGHRVFVTFDADFESDLIVDPGHDFVDVNFQLFGNRYGTGTVGSYNQGFVTNYSDQSGNTPEHGPCIMKCHSGMHVPVLTTLAAEFAVCTRWFCSVPGPTLPNRMFLHAASSGNRLDMDPTGYTAVPSVYERLDDAAKSWRIYAQGGITIAATLAPVLQACDERLQPLQTFFDDARAGTLPFYSVLEPRYADYEDNDRLIALFANDQHPNHDIRFGEHLIADVYEAIRDSPLWSTSALVIIYDEHGGTFDHRLPPSATPPHKDEVYVDPDDPQLRFAWDRLGPRVPAVIVSPLVERGTVDSTTYDHTSMFATLRARDPRIHPLTDRDAAASSLRTVFTRSTPRTDRPTVSRPSIHFRPPNTTRFRGRSVSHHNLALVQLAHHLTTNLAPVKHDTAALRARGTVQAPLATPAGIRTEADAAAFVRRSILQLCPHFKGSI
jgi:phospholipase C